MIWIAILKKRRLLSFSEGDCTILLAQTATVYTSPDLLLSVAACTVIVYAEYSYAQK
jgi:hypothetical protein